MRVEQITRGLIRNIEKFNGAFNAARFGSLRDLPGNQYQVEIREFGNALAVKNKSPELRGKQRVAGFGAADAIHLDELLRWYRHDGLRCSIQMSLRDGRHTSRVSRPRHPAVFDRAAHCRRQAPEMFSAAGGSRSGQHAATKFYSLRISGDSVGNELERRGRWPRAVDS